jgi:HlyD family type I secretion membrane fusion protein
MTAIPFDAWTSPPKTPDDPRWEIVMGASVAGVFFVGVLGWAAFAPMDAATTASGVVVVSGHRQSVQSHDGGIVSALRVKEGDRVQAGQILVQFAPAEAVAEERALAERVIGLEAERARLEAEQLGQATFSAPADFAALSPEDKLLADHALAAERRALAADLGAQQARRGVMHQRVAEANQQIVGFQRQIEANTRQQTLNADELTGMQQLAAKGYAPQTRVRALERSAASLIGDAGAQSAEIARLKALGAESGLESVQSDRDFQRQVADETRRAMTDLQQAEPQWRAARDRLARTAVAAPTSGAVVGLAVNTVGGVVAPGQRMMDLVPDRSPLIVEIEVAPRDAGELKLNQPTQVRLTGLHGRGAPVLTGRLTRISADSVVEERTGRTYFTADVTVSQAELDRLAGADNAGAALRPGMPAEVVARVRPRSALQYWLEPLAQVFWKSFHEH